MLRNNYMTTGEFAQMMKVTKHTLFHYDKIKLFCPEIVTEQNYRYYSIYQMETFNTIQILKDLGMSLEEIKTFLSNRSPEHFLGVFQKREQQIDREIEKLNATKRWMEQRKKKILASGRQDWNDVKIQHCPERYYILKYVEDTSEKSFFQKTNELITEFEAYETRSDYDIAYIQHSSQVENHVYNGYDNIALLLDSKPPLGSYETLPSGDYLTAYHVGHWRTIQEAYEKLLTYKASHSLKTDVHYVEYYVVDNFTAETIDDYVTEISVRIL